MSATYSATLYIWTNVGHTPITGRKGAFCDKLLEATVFVSSPDEARKILVEMAKITPHAHKGYYHLPKYPNQNLRHNWRTF